MTASWLVCVCQEARTEVDDSGVSEGAVGVDGGVACRLMVTVAELGEPMVYAVLEAMVTVRLPSASAAMVGIEMVSESDVENVRVSPVAVPCGPVQEYRMRTVTVSSRERETVKLAALPSATEDWSDVIVTVRVLVRAVAAVDQLLEPSELWALTSTS